jgi:arginyl-tRNA synthetase
MRPRALAEAVAHAVHAALPPELNLTPGAVAEWLVPPPRPEMGDLALPCFKLAKDLQMAPAKIATELAPKVTIGGVIAEANAAGPYLNLRLVGSVAAEIVLRPWAAGEKPEFAHADARIMVEYSQPNTHKAFHVGHMRNLALGDGLVRVLRATGCEVVAANYLGDVGTHIARCLWGYLELLDDAGRKPPEEGKGEWLGEVYARATNQQKIWAGAAEHGDDAAAQRLEASKLRIGEILRSVERRDDALTKLWALTRQWSLDEFDEIYGWLGVHFDRVFYESEVDEPSLALVDEFLGKGVFVEDDGAIGIRNPEIEHMPFLLLRKRDGTGLYATKDLALARRKFEEFGIDRSLYVVDVRQSDHFRHVFLTLEKMGFEQAAQCEHVPYEMVELPEGPMSTRDGTVVLFRRLREAMAETLGGPSYLGKYADDWDPAEIEATTRALSLGAIKYGMLSRDLNQKIAFDLEAWLNPRGNTGPYLQYASARAQSILDKAAARNKRLDPKAELVGALEHPAERAVLLAVAGLPHAVSQTAEQLRPSILCAYLHDLAQAYNGFQNHPECNVIQSEGPTLQGRLLLVGAVREALAWGLDLLGIPAPFRI